MPELTNLEIEKVFKGKSGESQYGPWQLYNIMFKGGQKRFGYMQSGPKPIPQPGMTVTYLRFDIEQSGQYTNNKIKEIKFGPATQGTPDEKQDTKAYIDHGKCIITLMEMAGGSACDMDVLKALIETFNQGIKWMTEPEQYKEPDFDDYQEPPPPEDDPGF